ncbi:hypothetical protein QYE76_060878 [Lolium multiflorum]|uniref:Uncharacterized protein n=1 Tax=Lolium multiflorum TaxID=4521 RepID=A0AAD8S194_LOLMU|nr:hypothetical protein QYE76_060878 [Lolium multiflorum]
MSSEPEEMPVPAPVVDARYCAAGATAFAVTKTISVTGHDFTVNDARGVAVMQVEAAAFSFLQARSLLLDTSSRRPVLTLQDDSYMATSRWQAYRGDSTSRRNLLFVAVKLSPLNLARTKVRVFLASNGSGERVPDFVISGSYYDGACTVSAKGRARRRRESPLSEWLELDNPWPTMAPEQQRQGMKQALDLLDGARVDLARHCKFPI